MWHGAEERKDYIMIFFFLCPDTPPLPLGKGHQEPWVFMGRSLSSSGLPCGSILSPSVPSVSGSDRGAVCGWQAPAVRQACAFPQAPCVGKAGEDVFTESWPGSARKGGSCLHYTPTSFNFPFWPCARPKEGWEFGKAKVVWSLPTPPSLPPSGCQAGPFLPRCISTRGLDTPFLLLM